MWCYTKRIRSFFSSNERCIVDNEKGKKLIKLADGNMICEDHAKLTP